MTNEPNELRALAERREVGEALQWAASHAQNLLAYARGDDPVAEFLRGYRQLRRGLER